MDIGFAASTAAIKSLGRFARKVNMLRDLNPTTRRYPRRMEEAFHDPIANAQWFYPPERNTALNDIVMGAIGIVLWVCIAYLIVKA